MSKKDRKRGLKAVIPWVKQLPLRVKVITLVAVIVVAALAAVVITLVIINDGINTNTASNKPKTKAEIEAARLAEVKREGAINDEAKAALDRGDETAAKQVYQNAINGESDSATKIKLIIQQSQLLYAGGDFNGAVTVAKTADSLSDDKYLLADWLSRVYENQQQYAQAAQYYTLAGKWANSPNNTAKLPKSYYDTQAARVTALAGVK